MYGPVVSKMSLLFFKIIKVSEKTLTAEKDRRHFVVISSLILHTCRVPTVIQSRVIKSCLKKKIKKK